MIATRPEWDGRTVVCIASGPSLTQADCETVRAAGHPVIVTNTTFKMCPWADVLYAYDTKWWTQYHEEVKGFKGRLITSSQVAVRYGVETTFGAPWFRCFPNSGASAISLALAGGASKVVLLAFDAGTGPGGERHWHADHPGALSNAASIAKWPQQFEMVAKEAQKRSVPVVNASRRTLLKCFPIGELTASL